MSQSPWEARSETTDSSVSKRDGIIEEQSNR